LYLSLRIDSVGETITKGEEYMKHLIICALLVLTSCSRASFKTVRNVPPAIPPATTPPPVVDDEDNDDRVVCHKFKKDLFKCGKLCYSLEDATFIEVSCKRNNGKSND
jgi:hypothetical protein